MGGWGHIEWGRARPRKVQYFRFGGNVKKSQGAACNLVVVSTEPFFAVYNTISNKASLASGPKNERRPKKQQQQQQQRASPIPTAIIKTVLAIATFRLGWRVDNARRRALCLP